MALLTGWAAFVVTLLTLTGIYALLTIGLNIHFGFTGLINFGHVAFFAAGAYTAALLTSPPPAAIGGVNVSYVWAGNLPMPLGFPVSLAAAALAGGILAVIIGLTSVRLASHYLAVVTFALAGVFHGIIVNEKWLTNGPFGLNEVPQPFVGAVATDVWQLLYLGIVAALVGGTWFVIAHLMDAPFGRLLKGIRDDEEASKMLGKQTNLVKLKSFGLGGAVAGLAGGAYAHYFGTVAPQQFVTEVTILVFIAMLLGGTASIAGSIVGAAMMIAFRDGTRFLPNIYGSLVDVLPAPVADLLVTAVGYLPQHPNVLPSFRFIVIGLILIVVIRFRPEGMLGDIREVETIGEEE
ncbi:branched-chain amino acid ABC transporter permease [Halobacteriales archaeon Cl-PHB]